MLDIYKKKFMDKIKNLGQVFTPDKIVEFMFSLSKKNGKILEPSCGDGAFINYIKNNSDRDIIGIEIDDTYLNENTICVDFFEYEYGNTFETIIGNPPYVAFKNIPQSTLLKIQKDEKLSFFDNRSNLFLFFIKKCIDHLKDGGEMIFITPREFIKSTSSVKLNNLIFETGTITDWYEFGDEMIFKGYSPNVVVWRYEKGNLNRITKTNNSEKIFNINKGQIYFSDNDYNLNMSDFFSVKVGAVSGNDKIFTSENGNREFVCSYTKKSGRLKKMFYNIRVEEIEKHKDKLLTRKIKKFNEHNWWKWGRDHHYSNSQRIYVNCKTRDTAPFFTNECKNYDGSVLALFPKFDIDIDLAIDLLNNLNWEDLGFKVGGRICFTQKSLQNVKLPDSFKDLHQKKV